MEKLRDLTLDQSYHGPFHANVTQVKGAMGQTINKKMSPLSSQGVILCIAIRAKGRGIVFFL